MQHSIVYPRPQIRLGALLMAAKYLLLTLAAALAMYEIVGGHWILLAISAALVLMISYRMSGIEQSSGVGQHYVSGDKYRDGGAFPGAKTAARPAVSRPVVSDGGSFKRSAI